MAIITKKIGGNLYAYHAWREGKKVIHKYLGSANDPDIKRIIEENKAVLSIPERLWYLFWDVDPDKVHLKENARYIIERVLELGDLGAVKWLQRVYTTQQIMDVMRMSRKITDRSRNFWELWFDEHAA
jgi:hypothetical protein